MRQQLDPSQIQPLGTRLLVKPYRLPEQSPGGIILPDPYRDNRAWSHYEFVSGSKAALRALGLRKLHPGAIIRTRLHMPADSGYDDPTDGQALLFLNAEEVEQIILWQDT